MEGKIYTSRQMPSWPYRRPQRHMSDSCLKITILCYPCEEDNHVLRDIQLVCNILSFSTQMPTEDVDAQVGMAALYCLKWIKVVYRMFNLFSVSHERYNMVIGVTWLLGSIKCLVHKKCVKKDSIICLRDYVFGVYQRSKGFLMPHLWFIFNVPNHKAWYGK